MGVSLLGIGKSGEGPGLSGVRDDQSPVWATSSVQGQVEMTSGAWESDLDWLYKSGINYQGKNITAKIGLNAEI